MVTQTTPSSLGVSVSSSVAVLHRRLPVSPANPYSAYDPAATIGPVSSLARLSLQNFMDTAANSPFEYDCLQAIGEDLMADSPHQSSAGEIWGRLVCQQGMDEYEPTLYVLYRGVFAGLWFQIAKLVEDNA